MAIRGTKGPLFFARAATARCDSTRCHWCRF